jgi:hypothetical protein
MNVIPECIKPALGRVAVRVRVRVRRYLYPSYKQNQRAEL